jgi:SAM-dependent methyltransferase
MRWIAKALVQGGLSHVPHGDALNYVLQRRVSRSLPVPDGIFRMHEEEARAHFEALRRHAPALDPGAAVAYEFGAGWDLVGPLTLATLGVGRQILVDIRANVRLELVNDTLRRSSLEPLASLDELEPRLGIRYLAPRDARATGLPDAAVDMVSSTFTLEHIPEPDIAAILAESARLLRPGGLVSCAIDLKDHYSYFDHRLGPYHFLGVSDRAWRFVNPSLHHQNRLRLPDYRRLFAEAGLTIVEEHVKRPTDDEQRGLAGIALAPRFRRYAADDLGALELRVVAAPEPTIAHPSHRYERGERSPAGARAQAASSAGRRAAGRG